MPAQWVSELVGKMHGKVRQNELATKLNYTPEYVSLVMNGKREPKNAEQKFRTALEELILEKSTSQE